MTTKEKVLEIINQEIKRIVKESYSFEEVIDILEYIKLYTLNQVQEPKIKQLEWDSDNRAIAIEINNRIILAYFIQGGYLRIGSTGYPFQDEAKAKAYAQEHFEGLIRGCYE